jgi:hypothetical protein
MIGKTVATSILSLVEIIEPEVISSLSGLSIDIKYGFHRLVRLYDFYGKSAHGENRIVENPIFVGSQYFGTNLDGFDECLFCLIRNLNKLGLELNVIHSVPLFLKREDVENYLQVILRYSKNFRSNYKQGEMNIYFTKSAFKTLKTLAH